MSINAFAHTMRTSRATRRSRRDAGVSLSPPRSRCEQWIAGLCEFAPDAGQATDLVPSARAMCLDLDGAAHMWYP